MASTSNRCLFIKFSNINPPYAEVAAFHLARTGFPLKLGSKDDLTHNSTLISPAGLYSNTTEILNGKISIARFMARLSTSNLYEKKPSSQIVSIDQNIEQVRLANSPSEILKCAELLPPFDSVSDLTVFHLLLWDLIKSNRSLFGSQEVLDWIYKIESFPEIILTINQVQQALELYPVLDYFKSKVIDQLITILNIDYKVAKEMLQVTKDTAKAKFFFPLPRLKLPGNPAEIAKSVANKFVCDNYITKCEATGPFLYFYISYDILKQKLIPQVIKLQSLYGTNSTGFGKSAVVEYSSPNIAKPFHAGHLRSTIIGNFVKNVLNASGWKTVSLNYLGDWGKQYGLLAIGYLKYGTSEKLLADPIRHLFEIYVKINAEAENDTEIHDKARLYFKNMEEGDTSALSLWKTFRDLSIIKYKEIFQRINVDFDVYSGESKYSLSQMQSVLAELNESKLLVPAENGAQVVDLEIHNLGTTVICKSDGTMLYISRDVAAAIDRYNTYKFDQMFYVAGGQQDYHFKQLFKILELMGKPWAGKCSHINFGLIKSKDGNMSTRKGKVVFLEEILDHTKEEMHNVMKSNEAKYEQIQDPEKVSDLVGISSIIIQDMTAKRHKDYEFDWSRMLSFEGDTGPYLQYAHSRLCSIERKYGQSINVDQVDLTLLTEPQAIALIDAIAHYPDLLKDAYPSFEPSTFVTFAYDLCHKVSQAVEKLYVQGQEKPLADARLALYMTARITLGNLLNVLGLKALERM